MKRFKLMYYDYCTDGYIIREVNAKELAEFIINEAYNHDMIIDSIEEIYGK